MAVRRVASAVGFGGREESYLQAVVALSDHARRIRRRITAGAIATVGAITLLVSLLASRASREAARADEAAALAQGEARQTRNTTRMAMARELLETDPTTALALLREVEPPGVPREWSDLALTALISPLHSQATPSARRASRTAFATAEALSSVPSSAPSGDPSIDGQAGHRSRRPSPPIGRPGPRAARIRRKRPRPRRGAVGASGSVDDALRSSHPTPSEPSFRNRSLRHYLNPGFPRSPR